MTDYFDEKALLYEDIARCGGRELSERTSVLMEKAYLMGKAVAVRRMLDSLEEQKAFCAEVLGPDWPCEPSEGER